MISANRSKEVQIPTEHSHLGILETSTSYSVRFFGVYLIITGSTKEWNQRLYSALVPTYFMLYKIVTIGYHLMMFLTWGKLTVFMELPGSTTQWKPQSPFIQTKICYEVQVVVRLHVYFWLATSDTWVTWAADSSWATCMSCTVYFFVAMRHFAADDIFIDCFTCVCRLSHMLTQIPIVARSAVQIHIATRS